MDLCHPCRVRAERILAAKAGGKPTNLKPAICDDCVSRALANAAVRLEAERTRSRESYRRNRSKGMGWGGDRTSAAFRASQELR